MDPAPPTEPAPVDRRPAWWAWPLILLVPILLIGAERWLPAAGAEAGVQQDLSLLAVLQFQAKVVIAMDGLPGGGARAQLAQLESYARSDGTAAALAAVHGFLGLGDGGREAVELILAKRRGAKGADAPFLETVARSVEDGVNEEDREALRARMGWFADLLGTPGAPDQAPRAESIRSGAALLVMLLGLVAFVALMAFLTGAGLLLLAVVRRNQGRLTLAFDATQQPSGVFLESFAIFLASMALGNLGSWTVHWSAQPILALSGLALSLAWPRLRGHGWRESRVALGWHRGRGLWREIGAGCVGYLVMLPMALMGIAVTAVLIRVVGAVENAGAAGAGSASVAAAPEPVTHPAVGWMLGGWEAKILVFLLAAVLAPLVEETFFRGAFFRSQRRRMGLMAAGLLNGLIFASLHPQGWMAIPALTAMGLGFALLREWRDSLIAPMVAHAINNGMLIGGLALVLS
jgi:membrane protease YdiL (CAAX protease family)